jgi:exodeoxyribonuclease VII large subunit
MVVWHAERTVDRRAHSGPPPTLTRRWRREPGDRYGPAVDQARLALEPDDPTLRVSQLVTAVQVALDVCFPDEVWVRGEISSLHRARSGHVYFQLIEPGPPGAPPMAQVAVTLFASDKASVNATLRRVRGVRMTDGVEIRIRGRLGVYGPQGQLQLKMAAIDPDYTLGRLASDRERILSALQSDGLLERNGRLTFPPRPRRVALITSAGSAAEADFLHELEQSGLAFEVVVIDSPVQGNDADRALTGALRAAVDLRVEVVAIVRGGGARTDLAAFDSERLARAIALLDLPVLTGIGHEIDTSVADEVAHTASKTPTACAAHLVAQAGAFHRDVDQLWQAVTTRAAAALDESASHLRRAETSATRLATASVGVARGRVDDRVRRLARCAPRSVDPARLRLDSLESRVAALDPARALARGWSITRTAWGELVRDPGQVHAGDRLVTTVAAGTVTSTVHAAEQSEAAHSLTPEWRSRPPGGSADQRAQQPEQSDAAHSMEPGWRSRPPGGSARPEGTA